MPLEIRELIIRATVSDGQDEPPANTSNGSGQQSGDEEALIRRVVEQVLRVLKTKIER